MLGVDMSGKICVVTGANSGLGLVTARELMRMGADVLMVARRREAGEAALAEVRASSPRGSAELLLADFASLDQVRALAAAIRANRPRVDVLVNNAGLMLTERERTRDGYEAVFAVNHLAPFLLTNLLLDSLCAAGRARVVTVASRAHSRAKLDFDDLQGERHWNGWRAYCASKLCNVLFNLELARRLEGKGVTANALHPGVIATGFGRENTGAWKWMLRVARVAMSSPEKGAATQIYLAASPDVEGVSGKYFVDCRPAKASAAGTDVASARRLWEISEGMTGLASATGSA